MWKIKLKNFNLKWVFKLGPVSSDPSPSDTTTQQTNIQNINKMVEASLKTDTPIASIPGVDTGRNDE